MKIETTTYLDGICYKFNNGRIIVRIYGENYMLEFKRLVKLTPKEKLEFLDFESDITKLKYRNHSKYCIWNNLSVFSKTALGCIADAYTKLDKIKPS